MLFAAVAVVQLDVGQATRGGRVHLPERADVVVELAVS